jgi:hypothetical protein
LEFQSYFKKIILMFVQNLFWKIQAIFMDRFAWVLKIFCFAFGEMKLCLVG